MEDVLDGIDYSKALKKFHGSACLNGCAYRQFNEFREDFECPAFPEGIPADIAGGKNRHSEIDERQAGKFVYTSKN
jgi:hypothetical protein